MTALLWTAIGGVVGILMTLLTDLISEEMRTRLDRLPQSLVKLAARRVPQEARDDTQREWLAELYEFLHGHEALPVTRLFRGTWFSVSLLRGAHSAGSDLKDVAKAKKAKSASATFQLSDEDRILLEAKLSEVLDRYENDPIIFSAAMLEKQDKLRFSHLHQEIYPPQLQNISPQIEVAMQRAAYRLLLNRRNRGT